MDGIWSRVSEADASPTFRAGTSLHGPCIHCLVVRPIRSNCFFEAPCEVYGMHHTMTEPLLWATFDEYCSKSPVPSKLLCSRVRVPSTTLCDDPLLSC